MKDPRYPEASVAGPRIPESADLARECDKLSAYIEKQKARAIVERERYLREHYAVPPGEDGRDDGITRGQWGKVLVMLAACGVLVAVLVLAANGVAR